MALHPPHEKEQHTAIEIQLATAPKIQDDLKEELGYEKNIFFDLDLFEYRINNSCEDIAEDLDVRNRYGLSDKILQPLISKAFRGHHNEDFKPEYQFEGLLGKETNDMIEEIRYEKGGLIGGRNRMELLSDTERIELARKGGLIGGLIGGRATVETHGEQMRKGALASNEAQGNYLWSLEEIADIHNFREESFNHSSKYRPNSPNWNYTTSKMNEKYGENWSTKKVKDAYHRNKDKLPDEEE